MLRKMSAKNGSIIRDFNPLRSRKAALATATLAGVCAMQSAVALAVTENFEWVGTDSTDPTLWNLTSLNWNNITTLQNSVAWANNADPTTPNAAFFLPTPTPGTVTVNANVDLGTLGFGAGGWNIAGGTGDLSFGSNGGNLTITTVNDNSIGANIVDRTAATSISVGNAGVVTLTGTNTYSGGTSLNGGGTLAIDSLARVGSGAINFNGGWLRVDGTALTSIDGRMAAGEDTARFIINDANNVFTMNTALAAGSGVLFAKGPGILVVSGPNLNTGATDLSTGAYLRIAGGNNRLNPAANMGIYEGSTLDLNGNNQEVAKLDSNDTSVVVTNSAASTTSVLTIGGVGGATYPGQLNDGAGTLALVKNGTATQTMTGTSTYSGGTTINGGILSISSDAALGAASGAVTLNSGTLQGITGISLDEARGIVLGAGGGTVYNLAHDSVMTINGVVSGASDLTKFAHATLPHGAVALTGNNTYDGATIINGNPTQAGDDATTLRGGLIAASNNALGSTVGGTTINTNAWLGLQGSITTAENITLATGGQITGNIRSLSGDNTLSAVLNAGTNVANFGVHAGSLRVSSAINSGILSTATGVAKVGAGTLIFDSAQTYAGRTLVQLAGDGRGVNTPGGKLKLEGTGGATASSVRIGATGTLLVDSSGNTADPVARTGSLVLGNGGTVIVNGNGANATTDSFGALSLGTYGGGDAFIVVNPGDGQTSTLSFASLTRDGLQNGSGNGPVLNIKGPNFGQAAGTNVAQATFTTAPGLSGGILKYLTITDTVSGRTRFGTNGANGIRQLENSEYNLGTPTGGGVMNSGNVQLTGGTTSITADATVNSLSLEGNGITVDGGFNLRSGTSNGPNALLSSGTGNVISTATLDFGSVSATAVDEAIIWVEGDLTVNSVIRNATGVTTAANLAVTKAGPGDLILNGDNTFLSDAVGNRIFRIGNGTVTFSSTGVDDDGVADTSAKNLGATNNQISLFSNGGLRLPGALGTVFVPQPISISSAGLGTVDGETAFIQVDAGSTLKTQGILHRPANTAGGFTKRGAGDLLLVGGANFDRTGTGKSYLAEGSLSFSGGATTYGGLQTGGWLVTSPGTSINFDASARPVGTSTRLGQVVFAGTQLNLTGNNANATQDQFGTFVLNAGGSAVAITAGAGQTTTLNMSNTAGSWQRRQGGTVVFSGASLGTAAAGVAKITASGGATGSIGGVLPYALADTTVGGNGIAFAVYGSNGITAVTTNTTSIAAGGNVRLSATDNTAGTVNSIHLDGTGISAGTGTLNVTSGGVLSTGGANSIDAALAFDGREGIIHAVSNLTVNGAVSSSVGLTKAGPGTLTLAGANNWSGPTYSNGGNLLLNNSLTSSSAVHAIKGKVQLAAGGDKVIHTGAVSAVAGGKIDLVDNKLITTSPAGTFVGSAYDGVAGLVDSARGSAGNAMWDGSSGITTSDTRAVNNGDLVSIGVAKVGEVRSVSDSQTTTFAGRTVLGSDTLAMVTWGGDANLDGKINIDDYGRIDGNVGQSGSVFGWSRGDFNYDGKINIDDYGIIDGNINRQGTPFSTGSGAGLEGVAAVPEPASLGLVALAGLGLTRRRRRRDI